MKTYYQFLGVSEDADEEEIRAAYRKCMLRIHPDLHPEDTDAQDTSQRMNKAFQTLVDKESREKYDESLDRQRELDAQAANPQPTHASEGEPKRPTSTPFAAATRPRKAKATQDEPKRPKGKPVKRRSFEKSFGAKVLSKLAPLCAGLLCAGIVVGLVYSLVNGLDPLDVLTLKTAAVDPKDLIVDLDDADTAANDPINDPLTEIENPSLPSEATYQDESLVDATTTTDETLEPSSNEVVMEVADDGPADVTYSYSAGPISLIEPSTQPAENNPGNTIQPGSRANEIANVTVARHPPPTETERQSALKLVAGLFQDQYRQAKSQSQKQLLAGKILSVAEETRDDVPGMFVLMRVARDMAIDAGDVELTQRCIESLCRHFELDQHEASLVAFRAIEKKVVGRGGKERLFAASIGLVDQFEASDAYAKATQACEIASSCARSLRNSRLMQSAAERNEQISKVSKKFAMIQQSFPMLANDGSDPMANREIGEYLCFWKGDWDRGLKLLASCTAPALSTAATTDLATTNEGALDAGDQWWAASESLGDHEQRQARARAVMFYLRARDNTTGLHRLRIEQRVKDVKIEDIAFMMGRIFDPRRVDSGEGMNPREGLVNSIGMKLTHVPAGRFQMGSKQGDSLAPPQPLATTTTSDEEPRHEVTISQSFYMGVTEVTVAQFSSFVRESGYRTEAVSSGRGGEGWNPVTKTFEISASVNWRSPGFSQTESHPVVLISWNDATAFCRWLSQKEGRSYRLPTEAEWEYACRAGTQTRYSYGEIPFLLDRFANVFDEGSARSLARQRSSSDGDDAYLFSSPAASFLPNRFGLFDMHGNAWEWCQDGYQASYYATSPLVDPTGPSSSTYRVNRGGSFFGDPDACRSAKRNFAASTQSSAVVGFRVVMDSDAL